MSVSTSTSKTAECPYPFAMGRIPSWADYDEEVRECRIKDMDEPLPPRSPLRDASCPEPDSGDDRSRSSSLCTSIAPVNPDFEKLTAMLKASATANQASRRGLNPDAPAFAMRVAPANPQVQAMKNEILMEQDNKYAQYASRRAECQEKGDIQAQIDLIVAGVVPQSEQDDLKENR
ncbi:hypothetical protein DL98DRAFT_529833 [Cadophora sp. DSE1049]|nr:hypothetical protein DL98DRAFT_529833 [Cadophora sp. DSE1049]